MACFEDSSGVALVFLGGGISPFSYEWDNGDTLYTRNTLAAGNYTITVTDALGCSAIEEFTITQPDEIIIDVVVNADNPSTSNPDGQVLIQPSGGTPPYIFDWENFGETESSLKTGLANGTYNVTVIDDNDCEKELVINVGAATSTQDLSFLEKIELYPNPANELLFLELPSGYSTDFSLEVLNPLGQMILGNLVFEKGNSEIEIDVENWSSGVYFFKIKTKTKERIFKINVIR